MKKIIVTISLLTLLLMAANPGYKWLVKLTIINKSGMPLEINITGTNEENHYYLRIPRGDRDSPLEMTFTVARDKYNVQVFYVEPWDPVYGYSCGTKSQMINIDRNVTVVFRECDRILANAGAPPSHIKFGGVRGVHRR